MNANANGSWTGLLLERTRRLPAALSNTARALMRRIAAAEPPLHSRMGSWETMTSPAARAAMEAMRRRAGPAGPHPDSAASPDGTAGSMPPAGANVRPIENAKIQRRSRIGGKITPSESQKCHLAKEFRLQDSGGSFNSLEIFRMKRYVIERNIPGVHGLNGQQRQGASQASNAALAKLAGKAHWLHSYVVENKTFCVYLAENEDAVREHAALSGFPANKINEVMGMLEPETANA